MESTKREVLQECRQTPRADCTSHTFLYSLQIQRLHAVQVQNRTCQAGRAKTKVRPEMRVDCSQIGAPRLVSTTESARALAAESQSSSCICAFHNAPLPLKPATEKGAAVCLLVRFLSATGNKFQPHCEASELQIEGNANQPYCTTARKYRKGSS